MQRCLHQTNHIIRINKSGKTTIIRPAIVGNFLLCLTNIGLKIKLALIRIDETCIQILSRKKAELIVYQIYPTF